MRLSKRETVPGKAKEFPVVRPSKGCYNTRDRKATHDSDQSGVTGVAKKMIAVVPLWDEEKESIWMLPGYLDGITQAGAVPVTLPLHAPVGDALEVLGLCGGLLLTGGQDVSPALYGEEVRPECGAVCPERDELEQALYARALERDLAVLGICRGIQLINVLQGGTLYQDLSAEHAGPVNHHMDPPYTRAAHFVDIRRNTPLFKVAGTERLGVNSYHHQAVKEAGRDLEVMAVSEDGLAEAVRHKNKRFVWALQWHPEFDFQVNPVSRRIFETFVKACS